MAWIFVCDRCRKASVDEGMLRRNGEFAGSVTIVEDPKHHRDDPTHTVKLELELCTECMNNHAHWVNGLDAIVPRHSEVPASG